MILQSIRYSISILIIILMISSNVFAQKRADQQKLYHKDSFSMILLGDIQGYVKYDINQAILELCTSWISDNIKNLNIKAVLCTGDLVEQNENGNRKLDRSMLNQTSKEMWEYSSLAFRRVDNKVPYFISTGNHDYGHKNAENSNTQFPAYFPLERNSTWKNSYISHYPNRNNDLSLENTVFELNDKNWGKILIITTEYYPRDEVLEWIQDLTSKPKYLKHKVILMTHEYLSGGTNPHWIESKNKNILGNSGKEIWKDLIYNSSNIQLVICGHYANGNQTFRDNVAFKSDKKRNSKLVHQMMFNIQTLGGGWEGNGGDGWLRILEFMPDGKTIKVRTYSPLFGISPSTKHLSKRTELFDQFDIILE